MKLVLKVNEETKAPVSDDKGRIIYIDEDANGKEMPLDPVAMYEKIGILGKENQNHRTKNDELVAKFSIFDDIEDIAIWKEEAVKALETVANFSDKDWMKADKVEKLKADITSAFEEKLRNKDKAIQDLEVNHSNAIKNKDDQIRKLLVSNKFAVSKHFNGTDESITVLPAAIAEDHFGKYFKVEDESGLPVIKAFYSNGDPVLSKVNPGDPADFEEAISLIIDQYPGKEGILRGSAGGSGGTGGGGGDEKKGSILVSLKKQYEEAKSANDTRKMVSFKNQIFREEKRLGLR